MNDTWQPDFISQLPLFELLTDAYNGAWQAKMEWPTIADYNQHAAEYAKKINNCNGSPIRFIRQVTKSQEFIYSYEPSVYLRGEVLTRLNNWHDFFNMLVWLTFPKIKAAFNHWQYHHIKQRTVIQKTRTPVENILTHLDENGVIVVSSDETLLELLRGQHWQELFWQRRECVKTKMQFLITGHALYEKGLKPYLGMTGSGLLFKVSDRFFKQSLSQKINEVDCLVSENLMQHKAVAAHTKLVPVPILGIPAWWPANAALDFYKNTQYFRAKKDLSK